MNLPAQTPANLPSANRAVNAPITDMYLSPRIRHPVMDKRVERRHARSTVC